MAADAYKQKNLLLEPVPSSVRTGNRLPADDVSGTAYHRLRAPADTELQNPEEGPTMAEPAHRHHGLDYVEISVTDVAKAREFYSSAFGWTFNDYGPDYAGIQDPTRPGAEVGGLAHADVVRPGGPLILLFSDDLDASAAAVVAAGGRVSNGPYDFPGGRRFHFTDPSGNELGVWAERS
jgi:predicted enzyme related to lactoylglutathione lyase